MVVVVVGGAAVMLMMVVARLLVAVVVVVTVAVRMVRMLGVERIVQRELTAEHEFEGTGHLDVDGGRNGDQRRGGRLVFAIVRVAGGVNGIQYN